MCILILKTKYGTINKETLKTAFNNNLDGAGLGYTVNSKIVIDKGYFDFNSFYNAYLKAELIADNNIMIHCRISTGGKLNKECCHPFYINSDLIIGHNGILDAIEPTSTKNDTMVFIDRYLSNKTNLFNDDEYLNLLSYAIKSNKFIIMNNKGDYKIINESLGHWNDNHSVWYSNSSYSTNYGFITPSTNKVNDYDYYNYDDSLYWLIYDTITNSDYYGLYTVSGNPKIKSLLNIFYSDKYLKNNYSEYNEVKNMKLKDYAFDLWETLIEIKETETETEGTCYV